MAQSNFERMIKLADEAFDIRNDPDQLDVNEKIIKRLQQIHPASVSEYEDAICWILVIPTTTDLMNRFLENKINEKQLFEMTPVDASYDALYLCSAMVLDEYRGKGIAKKLTIDAINSIRKDHPIKTLFVWAFSKEGEGLAESVARATGLPLKKKV
jgi:predicted GNAT family acetyltransferase